MRATANKNPMHPPKMAAVKKRQSLKLNEDPCCSTTSISILTSSSSFFSGASLFFLWWGCLRLGVWGALGATVVGTSISPSSSLGMIEVDDLVSMAGVEVV